MTGQGTDVAEPAAQTPLGATVVWSLQYVLGAAYLIGAGGLLLTAAVRTGDYVGLLDPGLERFGDPKDFIPPVGPPTLWNPLTWVFGLLRVFSWFIGEFAFLAALLGLGQLARADVRAHPRVFHRLLIGTLVSAALVALSFTGYGARLHTWLLD